MEFSMSYKTTIAKQIRIRDNFAILNFICKAKLQKEGIFFLIHLFARDILLMKKLEIEETKTT